MPAAALSIGNFDGVHLGHAALVARARAMVGEEGRGGGRVIVLAFDPSPLTVLRPGSAPPRLSTWSQRERWLRAAGADEVARLIPDPETLALTPEQFIERLVAKYAPAAIVEGPDFRFGRDRAGDISTLCALGAHHGFQVGVVEPVTAELEDGSVATVSSSLVRSMIEAGRARDAAALLGRPYEVAGSVVRGDRRGRTLGYPTANLQTECLAPADGVYAGRARLPDGRSFAAAVSVGTKPTFGAGARTIEAHLLEAQADESGAITGLPEYGWDIRLDVLHWVRAQVAFEGAAPLIEQMEQDCREVGALVGGGRVPAPRGVAAR